MGGRRGKQRRRRGGPIQHQHGPEHGEQGDDGNDERECQLHAYERIAGVPGRTSDAAVNSKKEGQ